MHNHGLESQDSCVLFGYNSRLDTLQAVVANHLLLKLPNLTKKRIKNAHIPDRMLGEAKQISLPLRSKEINEVFHLYCFQGKNRDELVEFLISNGIDAKKHYPILCIFKKPQPIWDIKKVTSLSLKRLADSTISLPVHEFVSPEQIEKMGNLVRSFIMDKIKVPFVDLSRFYKNQE